MRVILFAMIKHLLCLSLVLLSTTVQAKSGDAPAALASDAYLATLLQQADTLGLANSRGWRALLHYKPGNGWTRWESQADDPAFFLAEDGKTEPGKELHATLRALAMPVQGDVNQHPQCRFPARFHWLVQQLDIDPARFRTVRCEQLEAWFDTLRPGSLTLVFPAAYINSPSSMFGHTLLRVNPDDYRKDAALVAYALNYAANADATDSALLFSIKGLIGGYPGVFSIVPYYEKIREYRDLENRDVWEYSLDFSRDELFQLMRHAWEVRHIQFDYYFLTENCSYHMLSLMEAARPELDLTSAFDIKAIPSDTVRAVYDAGLVRGSHYRPATTTVIRHHASQMSDADNQRVIAITDGELDAVQQQIKQRPAIEQARIFEQAYDYSRFLATADPSVRDPRSGINWRLLVERSKLPVKNIWKPLQQLPVRAEEGHRTARLALQAGQRAGEGFLGMQFRPAYHDVLDPLPGYSRGAQINFLDLSARYYVDTEKLELEKLTFINVLSLAPRDRYFDPVSWGADFAIQRQPARTRAVNALQLVVNGGWSHQWLGVNTSLLGEINLKAASGFQQGYTAGGGLVLNLLQQNPKLSWQLKLAAVRFVAGEENLHQRLELTAAWHLDIDQSIRLQYQRLRDYDRLRSDVQIGWQVYF